MAGLLLHSLLVGAVLIFTLSAANALFVSTVGPSGLAYVYLAVAVVGPLSSAAVLSLGRRLSQRRTWRLQLLVVTLVPLALRWLLAWGDQATAAFALLVWYRLAEILLNLEFWGLAASLLHVRQAKRLYGLIGSGEVVALVVGGFTLPLLVSWIGSDNIILLAAGASALCLPLLGWIQRQARSAEPDVIATPSVDSPLPSAATRAPSPFVPLVFGLFLASVLMRYLVDQSFLVVAHSRFTSANQLTAFLGVFYACAGVATLVLRGGVTAPWLARFGLGGGLTILPASLGSAVLVAVGSALGALPGALLFPAIVGTKFFDRSLRLSIDRSAVLLLFQPLGALQRVRVQTLAEGVVSPLGAGLAGLLLLAIGRIWPNQLGVLPALMLGLLLLWLLLAQLLRQQYPLVLAGALQGRSLAGGLVSIQEPASRDVLIKALQWPSAASVLQAIEQLGHSDPEFIIERADSLLLHPAAEVRHAVLVRLEEASDDAPIELIERLANSDSDGEVRGAALRVLAAHDEERILEVYGSILAGRSAPERTGMIVGLLRHGSLEGLLLAARALNDLLQSVDPLCRVQAARVLADVGGGNLYRPLVTLLNDPDRRVRTAALEAAATLINRRLLPHVIDLLGDPGCRGAATRALLAAGEEGLARLIEELQTLPPGSGTEKLILGVLGRFRHPGAWSVLVQRMAERDPALRHAALAALATSGYQVAQPERRLVEGRLQEEVRFGAWLLAALADLEERPLHPVLSSAFGQELDRVRQRLLLLLSFLHPGRALRQVRLRYWTGSTREQALALELLESTIPRQHLDPTMPLLDRHSPAEALALLHEKYRPTVSPESCGWLLAIMGGGHGLPGDGWLLTCALYSLAFHPQAVHSNDRVLEAIAVAQTSANPVVAETARYTARSLLPNSGFAVMTKTSLTIEKVLLLTSVGIFSSTPSDVLVQLAQAIDEVCLAAGDTLFSLGDIGTAMYVIVEGRMRVHIDDQTIVELGEREIVGELAALDPEPRSASVSALVPSRLFRIEQETLLDLMTDQPEIVRGVIRELARRIRRSNQREGVSEPGAAARAH
ncbi:cyclic nucleotide-binding domain-containing protein [Synechococcus sp. CS-1329]|uniref:cyclic nucleotide-binding domain-containing protein n=1 Tax=Synechococcus sp. CS-1329 TaxID=2847975 RepID=UPI00223AE2FE|nr:cyclic nucleotide-binding domain-containing protein [Synechococcus sp. CS-1329]MCT0219595.1 cyclic nucleotide-binding domain-containing protein [Synechococcus sp. CS-1329]